MGALKTGKRRTGSATDGQGDTRLALSAAKLVIAHAVLDAVTPEIIVNRLKRAGAIADSCMDGNNAHLAMKAAGLAVKTVELAMRAAGSESPAVQPQSITNTQINVAVTPEQMAQAAEFRAMVDQIDDDARREADKIDRGVD